MEHFFVMSDKYTITLHGNDHRLRFKDARGIEVRRKEGKA